MGKIFYKFRVNEYLIKYKMKANVTKNLYEFKNILQYNNYE